MSKNTAWSQKFERLKLTKYQLFQFKLPSQSLNLKKFTKNIVNFDIRFVYNSKFVILFMSREKLMYNYVICNIFAQKHTIKLAWLKLCISNYR